MALVRVGSLPVSAINIGLAASVAGLTVKVAKLQADLTRVGLALVGQLEVALDFPPNPLSIAPALAAAINPLEVAAECSPLNLVGGSVDVLLDLAVDLAFVTAQLAVVEGLQTTLNAGLDAGGISGWGYSGPAAGFGAELKRYTETGFGTTAADAQVQAVIIASESLTAWQTFSQGVATGGTADAPASPTAARLAYLGEFSGRRWNSGVATLAADLDLVVADFRGQKSGIEASAAMAAGLTLPNVDAIVGAGADIVADLGIEGLLENMVNVSPDLFADIGGITAQIALVANLSADLAGQLSAGGLTFWSYSGSAAGLGAELAAELQGGIPSGSGQRAPAYGLILAGTPANMGIFGSIFKTS